MPCPFVPSGHFPTLWGIIHLAELSQLDRICLRLVPRNAAAKTNFSPTIDKLLHLCYNKNKCILHREFPALQEYRKECYHEINCSDYQLERYAMPATLQRRLYSLDCSGNRLECHPFVPRRKGTGIFPLSGRQYTRSHSAIRRSLGLANTLFAESFRRRRAENI